MRRKTATLFSAIFFLACLHTAEAQQASKAARIGLLFVGESSPRSPNLDAFRHGLRDLGYVEGKNIILEFRYADGKVERLAELAEELVRLPVDVIVTAASPAIHAARKA